MRFRVTWFDINDGMPNSICGCPIVLCIRRTTRREFVDVTEEEITVNGSDYRLPANAQRFIRKFDDGHPVKPFSFNIPGIKKAK